MSKIEWTERTWNPITGCTKVSPGCKHCYAETMAGRLKNMGVKGYENGFKVTVHMDRMDEPLKREKPTMYFVCSMSDLFHEYVGMTDRDHIFQVMEDTPQHTYQVLTKRPMTMRHWFDYTPAPQNAWLGVSVEDRQYGLPRIDELRKINASVKFLSIEPLLEDLGTLNLEGIDWVIVGGESGSGARPMDAHWVYSILHDCKKQNVPFFFKQWGAYSKDGVKRSKKANGRLFMGRTWDEMPKNHGREQ